MHAERERERERGGGGGGGLLHMIARPFVYGCVWHRST